MLCSLSVENYALIDSLHIGLAQHLNIITGETGAGKSILLGALGLLLGARSDSAAIKDTSRNCVVEGEFDLEGLHLEAFFEDNDLDYDLHTTLRRVLTPAGKSRAFVNDMPVTLTQLRDLGARLLDIHSQHQNLILSSEDYRTSAIDTVADNASLRENYLTHYRKMVQQRRRIAEMKAAAEEARRNEEWLHYLVDELTAAQLKAGEQAAIEEELAVLENADRISEAFSLARNTFDADETGVLAQLKAAESALSHIREHYPAAGEYADRLRSVSEELKDINSSVTDDSERLEADPERLSRLSARYDTLLSLEQKHHVEDEAALIALLDTSSEQLSHILHGDEELTAAEEALAQATAQCNTLAEKLRRSREKAAPAFSKRITSTLARLGMPDTRFEVGITPSEPGPSGADHIAFLFSANKNMPLQPVDKIASGGELSRVMLSLKALLAERMALPTIVFDEIDTGVSGRIADAMGEIIEQLSSTMQVIDITHLPQVASKGDAHFVVYKQDGRTDIKRLDAAERVNEIAKMLSGSTITEAAIAQAHILLGK